MMNKIILSLLIAIVTVAVTSCDDPLTSGENNLTIVNIEVELPELPEGAEVVDRLLTLKNGSSGKS